MRISYIDSAKGLAILLVVVGHVVAREPPRGAEWYSWLKATIYLFHMPLFIFLSGLTFGFGHHAPNSTTEYFEGLRKRIPRLLGGYLLLGVLIFLGKLIFQQFTRVDNPVHGLSSLADLLIRPTSSYTSFLWYVYALSILYAAVPLATALTRDRLWPLLALTLIIPFLPTSSILTWNRLQELSMFFVGGMICARHHALFEDILRRAWLPAVVAFAALVPWLLADKPPVRLDAFLAILGALGFVRLSSVSGLKWLKTVGKYTLSIYLLNTICIGLTKVVIVSTVGWDGAAFFAAFVLLTLAGICIPIVLKRFIFVKSATLDRIT